MNRQEQERRAEARWLDSLRYGYTDVHRTVEVRRSFDAQWANGQWVHDPHPEMFREATSSQLLRPPAPVPTRHLPAARAVSVPAQVAQPVGPPVAGSPSRDRAAGGGRAFFLILFWFTLVVLPPASRARCCWPGWPS